MCNANLGGEERCGLGFQSAKQGKIVFQRLEVSSIVFPVEFVSG